MGQSWSVVHKGGKEENYEVYIEDYVISFLKEEKAASGLAECFFFGFKEKGGKKYMIYGAGWERDPDAFRRYSLLEEVGCRLTQTGPVFLIKEDQNIYEVKGYEVFYQENREMQNYLIERKKKTAARSAELHKEESRSRARSEDYDRGWAGHGKILKTEPQTLIPQGAISVQLGIILAALVAIVINSTNSYEKMEQMNQSASEVFFAMENQEASVETGAAEGRDEIIVERSAIPEETAGDTGVAEQMEDAADHGTEQETILKLVTLENEGQAEKQSDESLADGAAEPDNSEVENTEETEDERSDVETESETENKKNEIQDAERDEKQSDTETADDVEADESGKEDEIEALSRNVSRYYKVERGDTLYMISQKIYGDTSHVKKICELNQITDPDNIRYGQKIILP